MVELYEFLPNPAGKDAAGEYVALWNNGAAVADLAGYQLKDASGKSFDLTGYQLQPRETVRFSTALTKISLNNDQETIYLMDPRAQIADQLSVVGALEGVPVRKNSEIDPALRSRLFEASLTDTIPASGFPIDVLSTGLVCAFLLALAAVFVVNKINGDKKEDPSLQPEWNR